MLTPDEGHLDRRIAQEANSLAELGWSVDMYPAVDPGLRYDDDLSAGVRLVASSAPPPVVAPRKAILRRIKRGLVRYVPPAGRLVEAMQYRVRDIARGIEDADVADLLSRPPYDLVFAHDIPVLPLAVRLRTEWSCPVICDLHEVFPEQTAWILSATGRRYWRSIESTYLALVDGIICVNAAVAEYVQSNWAPSAEMVVINNSVPFVPLAALQARPDNQSLRAYYPIPERARIMLWAGTLRDQTNLDVLISGFARARLDGWVLAVLGEGPLLETLTRLVAHLGLEQRVFLGQRSPQRDLVMVASSADMGVLAYQTESFNLKVATPNKLFEYVQARLPIATSRLPMVEQLIGPIGNGGLVDFATPESTADGLRRYVFGALNGISDDVLESAARILSWESDEVVLRQLVERTIGHRGANRSGVRPT
jgi:glycosyltransferase involved in cell wall biosynthesis